MKIYFDLCSLQRPLDDLSQLRVKMEAEAMVAMLSRCRSGELQLVVSDASVFEAEANPNPIRRDYATQLIALATEMIKTNDAIAAEAQKFIDAGLKPMDALHLASAVAANASYFCTCDDRFLRRARTFAIAPMKVMSPLELVSEIE